MCRAVQTGENGWYPSLTQVPLVFHDLDSVAVAAEHFLALSRLTTPASYHAVHATREELVPLSLIRVGTEMRVGGGKECQL